MFYFPLKNETHLEDARKEYFCSHEAEQIIASTKSLQY